MKEISLKIMRKRGWRRLLMALVLLSHFLVSSFSQSRQQWRDSLGVLSREIARSGYSADLHLRKAAVNLELQQWEYAVDEYKLILRHDEHNLAALFYRAYAYTHLRRFDLARNDYTDFLQLEPSHMEARLGLSYVLQQLGLRTEALDQLNTLVEQHPDSAAAYVARASLEADMGQYDVALFDWDEAIRRQPASVDYRLSRVDVLLRMGNREAARRELDGLTSRGVPSAALREWYKRLR